MADRIADEIVLETRRHQRERQLRTEFAFEILSLNDLFAHHGGEFVRLAYNWTLSREPSATEMKDAFLRLNGAFLPRALLILRLRFGREGRRVAAGRPRQSLPWMPLMALRNLTEGAVRKNRRNEKHTGRFQ